jgi:CheY-like chemotaxis protein
MVEFNIRETGNALLETLDSELGTKNACRLTVDVLIPERLFGDKPGLCNSILAICKYMDRNIARVIVDIELLRVRQYPESVQLNIAVSGARAMRRSTEPVVVLAKDDVERFVNSLPYLTTYGNADASAQFSFRMTFQLRDRSGSLSRVKNKLVLLAEDNDVSALVFMAFLEEWGWDVKRVSTGQMAIEQARNSKFDIMFIDIHMPGMSGIEAIQHIREFDKHVPIIALATSAMKSTFVIAREAGANRVITKPIDSIELHKILVHYFSFPDR